MDFGWNSGDHPPLTIDSSTVERVSSTKFLGVDIKEDLTSPTLHHYRRRHNSAYTFSVGWKEQASLHPSSPPSTGVPLRACWPAASLSGTGTVVQQTARPSSGQWTQLQRSSVPFSPPSWIFSLHDALVKLQNREGPHPSLPQSLPATTIRKTVPEHQSPLRQTAQQLFPPGCESPELKYPRPSLKPHTNPYLLKHGQPPPPPPPPLTLTTSQKKTVWDFMQFEVCYTQVSGPVQTPCSNTLSSIRTRHFSHIAECTKSHTRLNSICMFTCSCTTNHLTLFPSQLLDLRCFSLHMYSTYWKHSYSLYSLYFLVYV